MNKIKPLKVFDKINSTAEYVKHIQDNPYANLDCILWTPINESEKAYLFNFKTEDGSMLRSGKSMLWIAKKIVKEIEENYYVNKDGSFQKEKAILIPMWVINKN